MGLINWLFNRSKPTYKQAATSYTVGEQDADGFFYLYMDGIKTGTRILVPSSTDWDKIEQASRNLSKVIDYEKR